MSDHPLSQVPDVESARARATITSAFAADPVERWLMPDDRAYANGFPPFVAALADDALAASTAWQLDDFAAVAFWLPPGTDPNAERIGTALLAAVETAKHEEMFSILEQLDEAHPRYPHWCLSWLGVWAERQNGGLGSELLAANLEYVDLGGLPAYLETSSPRSVPFYERHGFVVTDRITSASCPPIALMLRQARAA